MQLLIRNITLIFSLVIMLTHCNLNEYDSSLYKPKAKKDFGSVLFSLPKKYWHTTLGSELKKQFEKVNKSTPLPYEQQFNIDFIVPENLVNNLKNKSCIVVIKIDPNQTLFRNPIYINDLWANGQLVVELNFKSEKRAVNYFSNNYQDIMQRINSFYFESIQMSYQKNNIINSYLKEELDLNIIAPKEMKLNNEKANFWWFSQLEMKKDQNGTHEIQKGIVVYTYPYYSESQFSINYHKEKRDSIGLHFLKGRESNSYMSTRDDDIAPIESLAMQINDKYVFKTTGAWRMVNDKMGGTYVNYAFLTHDKTEIINMEGYVYAPNFKKSKLIREVEAILYSAVQ